MGYTLNNTNNRMLLLSIAIFSFQCSLVYSYEYQVGGINGWVVPPDNGTKIYNDWASENRFQVGDTVRFKYKKDSIMEVDAEDYKKCNSSHPNFFSNTGNTVYHLNHSGPFYFISGVSGHCEKGQRMIIKVMSTEDSTSGGGERSAASRSAVLAFGVSEVVLAQLILSYVASYVFY